MFGTFYFVLFCLFVGISPFVNLSGSGRLELHDWAVRPHETPLESA